MTIGIQSDSELLSLISGSEKTVQYFFKLIYRLLKTNDTLLSDAFKYDWCDSALSVVDITEGLYESFKDEQIKQIFKKK